MVKLVLKNSEEEILAVDTYKVGSQQGFFDAIKKSKGVTFQEKRHEIDKIEKSVNNEIWVYIKRTLNSSDFAKLKWMLPCTLSDGRKVKPVLQLEYQGTCIGCVFRGYKYNGIENHPSCYCRTGIIWIIDKDYQKEVQDETES